MQHVAAIKIVRLQQFPSGEKYQNFA